MKNHYQTLGLSRHASEAEIHKAYLTYASKFHPDKHKGDPFFEERFKEVKEAYDVLKEAEERRKYDIGRFGKSKISGHSIRDGQDSYQNEIGFRPKTRMRFDIRHLDIYLTAFYLVNLVAWVIFKKVNENALPAGYVWGIFLTALSGLLLWFFIKGLGDWISRKLPGPGIFQWSSLVLALVLAYILLLTSWIP